MSVEFAGHERSVELLADIWERRAGALSTQVLAEFYAAVAGKLHMTSEKPEQKIRDIGAWSIHRPGHSDVLSAICLQRRDT